MRARVRERTPLKHTRSGNGLATLAACALFACACGPAAAGGSASGSTVVPGGDGDDASSRSRWFSLGVLTGATGFDRHLADYEWNVTPRAAWGVQALAGSGRFAGGLRVWNTRTTQHMATASEPNPAVNALSLDLVSRARVLRHGGLELDACASAGRLHLGYAPDHVTIPASGGGAPIDVSLSPIDEWLAGAGLALRHPVAGPWAATIEIDTQVFGMQTAHRSGNAIVVGREGFREWSARFELARVYGRR